MNVKTKGIVLKNTNYSESSIISKIYTRDLGLKTYMLRGVRKGKSKIRLSMIQPLSVVEMDVYQRPNSTFSTIRDLRNSPVLFDIHDSILKKSIALFMIEVLNQCLQEEEPDEILFYFLERQIIFLDQHPLDNTFPLKFLLKLSKYLGVQPIGKYSEITPFFSIEAGGFVSQLGEDSASEKISKMISSALHSETNLLPVSRDNRKEALLLIIKFYQYHITRNKKIKSVNILSELLN